MNRKIKIGIVDDHKLITDAFIKWYENSEDIAVVYTTNTPQDILHFLNGNTVDIILTDLNMPSMNGLDLIRKIRERFPTQKVAALTMYYNPYLINELNNLKINGFIHKNYGLNELTKAIKEIDLKGEYYTEKVSRMMINYDFNYSEDNIVIDEFIKKFYLSKRELEIFELIIRNHSTTEIAEKLHLSEGTISAHRKNIMKKTNCSSAMDLLHLAINQGIYQPGK